MSSRWEEVEKTQHFDLHVTHGIRLVYLEDHHLDLPSQSQQDSFQQHSVLILVGVSVSRRVCVGSSGGSHHMGEIVDME